MEPNKIDPPVIQYSSVPYCAAAPAVIASAVLMSFCPNCGTILDPPTDDSIKCTFCPFECKFHEHPIPPVHTSSAPKQRPTWVDDVQDTAGDTSENMNKHAVIEEPCPKCGNPELYFYTMQLRSVDEGSTVFYECPKCKHKYSQNN